MTDRLAACLPVILNSEAGWSDRAIDAGGPTMRGITLETFGKFMGRSVSIAELRAITPDQVLAIYEREVWRPSHAGDCPPGVDLMVFDAATNSGWPRAVRWLQQALGVTADDVVGPATLAAIKACDPAKVITLYAALREAFLHAQPTAPQNPGWFPRVVRTAAIAQRMAAAASAPAG